MTRNLAGDNIGMGVKMVKEKIDIPVIVCSSLNYRIPNISGSVWYNELNDLNSNFKEIPGILEKDS